MMTLCRKPVIYLLPPKPLESVTVSLRLVHQWSLTHIYPPLQPTRLDDGRQSITWSVSASPDGSLVEKGSDLELSYLFWEASAEHKADDATASSGTHSDGTEHFDPANPSLSPESPTAVLLPFAELLTYLDSVLKRLGLHTAARNDFITYWLPALSKQPYVALRFLPQGAYARAAELEVIPSPDVVTRVMMLFRGVAAAEIDRWAAAKERVGNVDWASVVGVDVEAPLDASRFRVLEWGGMEVP